VWLLNNSNLFLTFLKLKSPGFKVLQILGLVRACFLVHRWQLLAAFSYGGKGKLFLWGLFYKGTNPIHLMMTSPSPQRTYLLTLPQGGIYELVVDTSLPTIASCFTWELRSWFRVQQAHLLGDSAFWDVQGSLPHPFPFHLPPPQWSRPVLFQVSWQQILLPLPVLFLFIPADILG
jgi:hypothetical protein